MATCTGGAEQHFDGTTAQASSKYNPGVKQDPIESTDPTENLLQKSTRVHHI